MSSWRLCTIARPLPVGVSSLGVELQPASCSDTASSGRERSAPDRESDHRVGLPVSAKSADYREPDLSKPEPDPLDDSAAEPLVRPSRPALPSSRAGHARRAPGQGAGGAWRREFSRSYLQGLIAAGPRAARRRRRPAPRRAACAPASGWRWHWCPPTRAAPSRPQPMALAVAVRGRAPAGARQAGRAGRAPGARQLVGHAAQRAAGPPRGCGDAAACRHRAPPRQGHLGRDGGGQDAAGDDGAGARHRRARRAPRATWRWRTARSRPGVVHRSRRRSGATRCRVCAWPWCRCAGEAGAHRRAAPGRQRRRRRCRQRAAAARCTPAAPTRSASTWPRCGHPLVADALYGGHRRWACSARRCMPPNCAWHTRSRASPLAFDDAAAGRPGRGLGAVPGAAG